MFSRLLWLFLLIPLLLMGPQTTVAEPPIVDPPPPLSPLSLAWTAQEDDIRVVQISPSQDAFIANGEGVRDRNFGKEEFLLVGQFNNEVIDTRTMVSFRWQPPEDFVEIVQAILFFGVADGADTTLPVSVYYDGDPFNESNVTWSRYAYWGRVGPVHGELGKKGYWYAFDVTSLVKEHTLSSYRPIGFSIRAEAFGYKFYKVSHSRESDPELAPQLVIRYRIDNLPPEVWFEPNPLPEWARPMDTFWIRGEERPVAGRPFRKELQYQLDGGPWHWHPISGPIQFLDAPGKTVRYRLRGIDRLGHVSDWVYSTPVKLYTYDIFAYIKDPRGRPLPPVAPEYEPTPWWVQLNPDTKKIVARMTAYENIVATVRVPGYGVWEREPVHVDDWGTHMSFVLPPPDNRLPPHLIEDPDLWQAYGTSDGIESSKTEPPAQGGHSLLLIAASSDPGPALFCYKQMLTLDDSLNLPIVGLRFYGVRAKDFKLYWKDEKGVLHSLTTRGEYISKQNIDVYTPSWHYVWGDVTPFQGKRGQLCLSFRRPAPRYHTQWQRLYLDRLALGSMPTELTLTLTAPPGDPRPGQTLPITLTLANRSVYTATVTSLHYMVDGVEGDISFPSLPPGGEALHELTITMPQEGELLFQAVAGRPEIDLTPEDNAVAWIFILHPRHQFLPLMASAQSD